MSENHSIRICVPSAVIRQIGKYGGNSCPNEACGVIYGHEESGRILVTGWRPVDNVAEIPALTFEFSPEQWVAALYERCDGQKIIGAFHTHPSAEPLPSARDKRGLWSFPTNWIFSFAANTREPNWRVFDCDWSQISPDCIALCDN